MTSTLPDILPSIGLAASPRFHPAIWPITAHSDDDGRLCVGEVPLTDIADQFGTPTYVIDEADFRSRAQLSRRLRQHRGALRRQVPADHRGGTLGTRGGLGIDVCSAGELAIAMAGGVEKARIVMHGNAKSQDDLRAAVRFGVGRIVLDSTIEITDLAGLAEGRQRVLIRVTPDLDIHGHRAVTTGIRDQKFGFTLDGGPCRRRRRSGCSAPGLAADRIALSPRFSGRRARRDTARRSAGRSPPWPMSEPGTASS